MLINLLNQYVPYNEQEAQDLTLFKWFLNRNSDAYDRENLAAHVTSSAIILNQTHDKVLFIHHNIYNSWGWVGGHNDGEKDCLKVALKEAKEETGLNDFKIIDDHIFMVDVVYVPNHIKNGSFISDHLHLNVTYLLEANDTQKLSIKPDENTGVKWFDLNKIIDVTKEERMKPIYQKAIDKINQLSNEKHHKI